MHALVLIAALGTVLHGATGQNDLAPAPGADGDTGSAPLLTGDLSAQARQGGNGIAMCTFHLQGSSRSSSTGQVSTSSIDVSSAGSGLSQCDISCSGSNITIQGGPSLEPFANSWKGVTYVKNIQLPGSTMTIRGARMAILDSTFTGLQSFGNGALGLAASNVTILNATFVNNNNSAAACIYANESTNLMVLDSNFTNNFGLSAGSMALWNSSVTVNNTLFLNNSCNSQGGAILVNNGQMIDIMNSTFKNNTATNGGALYFETCGNATVVQNIFANNEASKSGGAVFQLKCPGAFLQNTFQQNAGQNGAAVWHNNLNKLNHTLNLFMGNAATNGSGAIELNQINSMSITGCNFTMGRGQKGGGVYTQDTTGNIVRSYFGFNVATTNGGGIFRGTSTGSIVGCTFLNNTAASDGGAIYDSHVEGDISNNTFVLPSGNGTVIRGIFRTVSSGSVSNNTNLPTNQVSIQQPTSG